MMNQDFRLARRLAWVAVLFCLAALLVGTVSITFAAANDNNVEWNGLAHNSRDTLYRTPGAAVPTNTVVKLRLRALVNDLTAVQMRIWNGRAASEQIVNLTRVAYDDIYEYWEYNLNTGALPNAYYYRFIAKDGSATAYYQDNDQFGGFGDAAGSGDDFKSWQLTVYDPSFQSPEWVKNAVIYQIFPDRFRDGTTGNDTPAGTFFYNEAGGTIYRSATTQ